ncbi:hypothetical protein [Arthrobacter sp. MYb227]|uniref:hypothetical protein n=1 Tax=Arthrobacter sp. MYb227 TaxID=1848601 RepID=UPI0015E2B78D|nr:hypothetical protein [Arthrobacter sp. MYb227]
MGPSIPTGSLGFAVPTPVAEVVPGQVVSVVNTDGIRLTHRVVENLPEGLVLKGDANSVADLQPYQVSSADRLIVSVPFLGYVLTWFSQPWAFFVGGLLCAYLLYLAFFRREPRRDSNDNSPGSSAALHSESSVTIGADAKVHTTSRKLSLLKIGTILTALAVVLPLAAANSVERTLAVWSSSSSAGTLIQAATMPAPTNLYCGAGTNKQEVIVRWSEPKNVPVAVEEYKIIVTAKDETASIKVPAGSTSYTLSIANDAGGLLGTVVGLLGGLLQLLLGGAVNVSFSVVAIYPGDWESASVSNISIAKISKPLLTPTQISCN